MNGCGSILMLALVFGLADPVAAQSLAVAPIATTAASELYPEVTCTSTDPQLNVDILQLANDTRDQLTPVLGLASQWRFPVHIHVVMADDPLAGKIQDEGAAVTTTGKSMTLDAILPSTDPQARSFIQEQFVSALLWEKFFANSQHFDKSTQLTVVPLWLVEGLNEWLRDDSGRNREGIVRRAASIHRAPSLSEIIGWEDISQDRLLGLYQRAFCYYLVNSLIHGQAKRADFQQWLATFAGPNPKSAAYLFPTEAGWQQELLQAPSRSHDLVFTWDESSSALADAETIAITGKKPEDTRITTLDTVLESPSSPELTDALRKKIFDLTSLELRAHPSWRPIMALYRFGLSDSINGHPQEARRFIVKAQESRRAEVAYHQKLTDYINWFEVTKDYTSHSSGFDSYFSTAQAMDKVQADPDRPNPLRANLLHVESQL